MIWLKNIRGLKVVYEGKCIGRAIQGCLCDSLTVLDGFWMDRALLGLRFISAEHICVLGKNSIIVGHPGERLRMKPQPLFMRAVAPDGTRLGAAVDALVDRHTLTVSKLAINTGWFDSLAAGLQYADEWNCDMISRKVVIPSCIIRTEVKTI